MSDVPELPPIERLQVVDLRPGDHIIVTFPEDVDLSRDDVTQVVYDLRERFPDNPVLAVCGCKVEVSALRPSNNSRTSA